MVCFLFLILNCLFTFSFHILNQFMYPHVQYNCINCTSGGSGTYWQLRDTSHGSLRMTLPTSNILMFTPDDFRQLLVNHFPLRVTKLLSDLQSNHYNRFGQILNNLKSMESNKKSTGLASAEYLVDSRIFEILLKL